MSVKINRIIPIMGSDYCDVSLSVDRGPSDSGKYRYVEHLSLHIRCDTPAALATSVNDVLLQLYNSRSQVAAALTAEKFKSTGPVRKSPQKVATAPVRKLPEKKGLF